MDGYKAKYNVGDPDTIDIIDPEGNVVKTISDTEEEGWAGELYHCPDSELILKSLIEDSGYSKEDLNIK